MHGDYSGHHRQLLDDPYRVEAFEIRAPVLLLEGRYALMELWLTEQPDAPPGAEAVDARDCGDGASCLERVGRPHDDAVVVGGRSCSQPLRRELLAARGIDQDERWPFLEGVARTYGLLDQADHIIDVLGAQQDEVANHVLVPELGGV